jgi:PAS domain S-box-containing protein
MVEPRLGGASSVSVTKITDTAGAVVGFVHVIRDLTVRIESERDVRRSRDFLDCVINAVADPVFVKDSAHRWVLLNDAECALTSRTREEMLGKTDHDFFPADQADAFWAKDDEVLGTGLVNRVVEELTDSSGSDRVLLTTKARHIDPDGQPLIVGISKDITDLVRAEKELRQSRARLESLYRLATTTFESDQELMAFALEEVVRLTESEFAYAHFMNRDQVDLELFAWSRRAFEVCTAPVDRKYPLADAGVWADCARIGRPVIHNDYGTLPKRQGYPEGHVPIRSHMSVPVLDGNQVVMIAGVANREGPYYETDAHDFQLYMTEVWHLLRRREAEFQLRESRRSLEDEVKRRTRQLEATVEELDAFAYSVSHDLMAPVRHMDQFGSFLHEDYGSTLGEDGRQLVERIRGGARRMGVLIQALLDLSRTSRAELRRGEVDIGEVALRVVEELRAEHPGRAVAVEIEAGLAASCDAELAAILLRNLLGNAWKFTSETADARIEVGRADGEGGPRFFVRDNGAGFDAERAPRLFTAFQRFHSEGEFPGTGIGLATARRIVRRHGGDIRAESTPGLGATFYFTLEE